MWHVGDEDRGCRLARVPIEVDEGSVGFSEVVVPVKDRREDDEDTEREDAAEDDFAFQREASFDEDGEGDVEHQEVRRDVEHGRGDEMVVVGRALCWYEFSNAFGALWMNKGALCEIRTDSCRREPANTAGWAGTIRPGTGFGRGRSQRHNNLQRTSLVCSASVQVCRARQVSHWLNDDFQVSLDMKSTHVI